MKEDFNYIVRRIKKEKLWQRKKKEQFNYSKDKPGIPWNTRLNC